MKLLFLQLIRQVAPVSGFYSLIYFFVLYTHHKYMKPGHSETQLPVCGLAS